MAFVIQNIIIYPIKGMRGISVDEAVCCERGLQHDRRYMLIDDHNKFLSQREIPELCKFKTSITENGIAVEYKGNTINFSEINLTKKTVVNKIWSHEFASYLMESKVSDWFSEMIGRSCKLVHMNKEVIRTKSLIKSPRTTKLSYADGYPYLILGTKSIEFLNSKLSEKIHPNRFRPNIIVKTTIPHEEDKWDKIEIGNAKFRIIKPCARCNVITINQEDGLQSKEPLATLAKYRKDGNKINFGANAVLLSSNEKVKIGDKIKLE